MSTPIKPRQLLARLRTLAAPVERVPEGARTAAGWAKVWGMSFKGALDYLKVGVRTGALRRIKCRVRNRGGAVRLVPYYLPVKTKD